MLQDHNGSETGRWFWWCFYSPDLTFNWSAWKSALWSVYCQSQSTVRKSPRALLSWQSVHPETSSKDMVIIAKYDVESNEDRTVFIHEQGDTGLPAVRSWTGIPGYLLTSLPSGRRKILLPEIWRQATNRYRGKQIGGRMNVSGNDGQQVRNRLGNSGKTYGIGSPTILFPCCLKKS